MSGWDTEPLRGEGATARFAGLGKKVAGAETPQSWSVCSKRLSDQAEYCMGAGASQAIDAHLALQQDLTRYQIGALDSCYGEPALTEGCQLGLLGVL